MGNSARSPARRPLLWTLFFAGCAFVLFVNAGGRLLSEPDELRYLEVAREMEERSSWVLPLYNYQVYLDKGPLFFYLLAGARRLADDPFRAALLPAQIFSLLSLLAAFALFRLWGWSDRRIALALAMLLASIQFFLLARFCRMDALLAFFVLAGYLALFHRLERSSRWSPTLFGLCTAFGLLTKGPVVLLWMWLVPLGWAAWTRDRRVPAFLIHPANLAGAILPVLAWLLPAYGALGPDLWKTIFVKQTTERLVSAKDHVQPWYYYLATLPLAVFPGTLYFLRGAFRRPEDRADRFLLVWVAAPLALFSLMSGKLVIYLLPLLPAAAGFAGSEMDRLVDGPPRICRWCHWLTAVVFIAGGAAAWSVRGHDRFLAIHGEVTLFAAALAGAGLLLLAWGAWRPCTYAWGLAGATLAVCLFPVQTLLREGLPHQTTHALAAEYARLADGQARGYSIQDLRPSCLYYLRRPVEELHGPQEVLDVLRAGNAALVRDRAFATLPLRIRGGVEIVAEQELTRRRFYIIKAKSFGVRN
jgi:4-amino-4-deoxy-L-arabinose transferase-like glycosyltransferase